MISDHWPEILIVLLIALVVFGPKRLPELGQALGKAINEFRHATQSAGEEFKSVTSLGHGTPSPTQSPAPATVAPDVSSEAPAAGRPDPPV